MAIASGGTLGSTGHSTSASSFTHTTTTASLSAGDQAFLLVVCDNRSTSDGATNDVVRISGGVGFWVKLGEYTNSPGGVAADGVTVAVFRFIATGTNAIGTVFTVELSGTAVDKTAT